MKKIINFRSLNVFVLEKERWDIEYHNHNFYEVIFVEQGRGRHRMNAVEMSYQQGDIFFLRPSDAHEFEIARKTRFIYLKYSEQFLQEQLIGSSKGPHWKEAIRLSLLLGNPVHESIVQDTTDQQQAFALVNMLLYEFRQRPSFASEMITDLFAAIITIIARNLNNHAGAGKWITQEGERLQQILSYINAYAFDNEKLKIENLASVFLLSPNYISVYVKKHTGLSVQQHIMQYRMKAAEKLLRQSVFNISEIAGKLGFNDASHFNKLFKKYKALSPTMFRKMG